MHDRINGITYHIYQTFKVYYFIILELVDLEVLQVQ